VIDSTTYGTYRSISTIAYDVQIGQETNNDGSTSADWSKYFFTNLIDGSWTKWDKGYLYETFNGRSQVKWDTEPTSTINWISSGAF
jgi:hypothetical protein